MAVKNRRENLTSFELTLQWQLDVLYRVSLLHRTGTVLSIFVGLEKKLNYLRKISEIV